MLWILIIVAIIAIYAYRSRIKAVTTPVVTTPVVTTQPTPVQPVVTSQPTVTQPVVTSQPTVTQPVITSQPVVTQPIVISQPAVTQPITQPIVTPEPVITQPTIIDSILSYVIPTKSDTTESAPVVTQPVIQPVVSDPVTMPTPAEIVAINNPTPTTDPVPVQTTTQSTATATTTTTTTTATPSTIATVINWCTGGRYCNGTPVPESAAKVGAVVCGASNYKYVCKQPDPKVAPTWVTDRTICATGLPGRCPDPVCKGGIYCNGQLIPDSASKIGAVVCGANNFKYTCTQPDPKIAPSWKTDLTMCATGLTGRCPDRQVVYRNDGTVSGTRYCGGVNKAPWWNELPVSWNGAKCVSAGFNGVTGVGCDVVPGSKPGFMVLCAPTGTGWKV